MGGPCRIVQPNSWRCGLLAKRAPACTDNFQICRFSFDGCDWHSVEQCFQAMKFRESSQQRQLLQRTTPRPYESAYSYGMRVWEMGQARKPLRPHWEAVKVELMYRINVAKYAAHPQLQTQLLSTGDALLVGAPSTAQWQKWNAKIQMRIRAQLRPQEAAFLQQLEMEFSRYMQAGGLTVARANLPEAPALKPLENKGSELPKVAWGDC